MRDIRKITTVTAGNKGFSRECLGQHHYEIVIKMPEKLQTGDLISEFQISQR